MEKRLDQLEKKVDTIMNNHLFHIELSLNGLKWQMRLVLFILAAFFVAYVGSLFK